MNVTAHPRQFTPSASVAANPWRAAFRHLLGYLRRWWWAVLICAIAGAGLSMVAMRLIPPKYSSTSQLLFDPRGIKIFQNDMSTGYHDANAAINFVESQMAVIQSERVLSRVLETLCATGIDGTGAGEAGLRWLCPYNNSTDAWARSLAFLRRMLVVKRTERSFVVDITAIGRKPELAAALAKMLVAAYLDVDAQTRAEAAARLTNEIAGRLHGLREALRDSETKAEFYRHSNNLVRVADKLIVEQRLTVATAAMNDAQTRLDRAMARARQIETTARAPSALGAIGAEADTRALLVLMERRNAIMVEVAPIAARAGARHPALIEVRSRLAEVERSIAAEMGAIRLAAQADVVRVRTEQAALTTTVADLSTKLTEARRAEMELRRLEQEVDANRKLLEAFEVRARETSEFGKIDPANIRVVSVARAPESQNPMTKMALWAIIGTIIGLILSLAAIMTAAILSFDRQRRIPVEGAAMSPAYAMQMRVKAFAQYRYG